MEISEEGQQPQRAHDDGKGHKRVQEDTSSPKASLTRHLALIRDAKNQLPSENYKQFLTVLCQFKKRRVFRSEVLTTVKALFNEHPALWATFALVLDADNVNSRAPETKQVVEGAPKPTAASKPKSRVSPQKAGARLSDDKGPYERAATIVRKLGCLPIEGENLNLAMSVVLRRFKEGIIMPSHANWCLCILLEGRAHLLKEVLGLRRLTPGVDYPATARPDILKWATDISLESELERNCILKEHMGGASSGQPWSNQEGEQVTLELPMPVEAAKRAHRDLVEEMDETWTEWRAGCKDVGPNSEPGARKGMPAWGEIDTRRCKPVGASYRLMPKDFARRPACTGRTAHEQSVLNEECFIATFERVRSEEEERPPTRVLRRVRSHKSRQFFDM